MANPLHQYRYPKRSYLTGHKQIDLSTRIRSSDRLVDRPHNAPSFVFSTASTTPKRNDDDEEASIPQGGWSSSWPNQGKHRVSFPLISISFRLSCAHFFPSFFHTISSLRPSLSAAVTQHTRLWFDRLRHIFFGMVKSSQGTLCNNGIRSASPHGLRITYHAPLSSSSVDVEYHLEYPYVTCRFVQRCTRQNAPLQAAVLKSMHLIEEFLE
jgi:hypothetical protein